MKVHARIPVVIAVMAMAWALLGAPAGAVDATRSTTKRLTVSLTFDDGFATAYDAAKLLHRAGYAGTFYLNTGLLGRRGRLTWAQVKQMAAMGEEIGGHTANHLNLPGAPKGEQLRQICNDRNVLIRHGLAPRSFAYPFGSHDATSMDSVARCGYDTGRITGGLTGGRPRNLPAFNRRATNRYELPADPSIVADTAARTVTEWLDSALHQGGWTILVMHQMCQDCSSMAVHPAVFAAIIRWLHVHKSQVEVAPVGQVAGGPVKAQVTAPAADTVEALLRNGGLAQAYAFGDDAEGVTQSGGNPDCWSVAKYGSISMTHGRTFEKSLHAWVQKITVTRRSSGDAKLIVTQDSGGCAPFVEPGHSYAMSARVRNNVPTRFVVFLMTHGQWNFYRASPWLGPHADWQSATWTTPSLPEGSTRMSFGLAIAGPGRVSTTDYHLQRAHFHLAGWIWALLASVVLSIVLIAVSPLLARRGLPRVTSAPSTETATRLGRLGEQ